MPRCLAIDWPISAKLSRRPIRPRRDAGRVDQHRHAFARVIGAAPGRIAAVIGGDDQEIAVAQLCQELRQAPVERLERARIAFDIAAMAMLHVEIDEIDDDQSAIGERVERGEQAYRTRRRCRPP